MISWEGGAILPRQNLGALAEKGVRGAVYALGLARVAKFSTSELFPGEIIPPPCIYRRIAASVVWSTNLNFTHVAV